MLDVPSISAIVATIGVLVGVTLAYLEVRALVKARQTELVTRLYSTYGSRDFQEALSKTMTMEFKDYDDWRKKYSPSPSWPESIDDIVVTLFFEEIGVLLHRKLIDIGLVDDLFSSPIKWAWEKTKPITEGYRKWFNRPQIYEWFEYLYNEMQKREQQLQQTQQ